jgi:hypothetical protein
MELALVLGRIQRAMSGGCGTPAGAGEGREGEGMRDLDPENRRSVERLLAGRARRLAALDQHGVRWPQTLAQLGPVMDNAFAEVRTMVEDERQQAYARRRAAWVDEVRDFLREIERAEENAWLQRGRPRCPFCGTKERDDDDGSWQHEDDCVAYGAHDLLMREPIAALVEG